MAVLKRIHPPQAARGHVPRSREAMDAEIAAMRQEDEDRLEAIEQPHGECQRSAVRAVIESEQVAKD